MTACLGGLLGGDLCLEKLENKKTKTFCREKHAVLKGLDSTGGAPLCWPCAWWGCTAESTNKRKSCSCATFFLPKLESVVISFLLWSLKSEPFGNPGAVTGFPFVVFLQSQGGGVFQTLGKWHSWRNKKLHCPPTFIFLISEPNDESGANVDASKMWREDREQFNKIAKQIVQKSLGL